MTTNEKQFEFTVMLGHLLMYADRCGYDVSIREVWRSKERQLELFESGKSKTMDSKHRKSLAADLIIFRNGQPLWGGDEYQILGEYWEQLGGIWGGRWDFYDPGHYEHED